MADAIKVACITRCMFWFRAYLHTYDAMRKVAMKINSLYTFVREFLSREILMECPKKSLAWKHHHSPLPSIRSAFNIDYKMIILLYTNNWIYYSYSHHIFSGKIYFVEGKFIFLHIFSVFFIIYLLNEYR